MCYAAPFSLWWTVLLFFGLAPLPNPIAKTGMIVSVVGMFAVGGFHFFLERHYVNTGRAEERYGTGVLVAFIGVIFAISLIGTGLGEDYDGLAETNCREKAYGESCRNASGHATSAHRMCKFWLTDDGWNGSCAQPSIAVQAGSFEHAKSEIEIALGKHIEGLLREAQQSSKEQAA